MQNNKKKDNIKMLVMISVLSAISFVLFLFPKFPIIPLFSWLDIDFSDVPALFASVAISPLSGVAIVLIKNVIHLSMSSTGMVGELSNFLIGAVFVFVTGVVYRAVSKHHKKGSSLMLAVICGAVAQILSAVLVNYYIMIPMYSKFVNFAELGGKQYYIYAGVIPFNFVKDIFVCVVFIMMYRVIYSKANKYFTK